MSTEAVIALVSAGFLVGLLLGDFLRYWSGIKKGFQW